jgi:phosphoenolpyruvate synthase/pyruvate phosphate dikinase
MKYQLGLSAEHIEDRVSPIFAGVGLLRSEYLCRKIDKYITLKESRDYIQQYVRRVARIFAPDPVWYRTTEMETSEVNVLEGADHIVEERTSMLGYRGIRRGKLFKETFLLELSVLAEVASEAPNVHVLIPFINDPSELLFVKECLNAVGFKNKLGIMAEIPATILCLKDFLEIGVDNITVGMNDLSSLVMGAIRCAELERQFLHPAMQEMLIRTRDVTRDYDVTLAAAGYINRDVLAFIDKLGFDYAVIHYSNLHKVLGAEFKELPYQDSLEEIKARTRNLIRERSERLAVEKWMSQQQLT